MDDTEKKDDDDDDDDGCGTEHDHGDDHDNVTPLLKIL
jgi:hypothetical protein